MVGWACTTGVADYVDEEDIGDLELNFLLNLCGHGGEFYSVASESSTSFCRRQGGDDFLLCWQACRLQCADLQPTPAFA